MIGALGVAPWFRARFSPNALTLSANLLVILAYVLMGFVRQTELFLSSRGAGWHGMDALCLRTLGGGAARRPRLGPRPHERYNHDGLARRYGYRRCDLG